MALVVEWLGRVAYAEALRRQQAALEAVRQGGGPDRLLLLEHPPVVTLGRSARPGHLRVPPDELARRGIELFEAARGGDVTYHGPGQLVGYLVADLRDPGGPDVHRHLRRIESTLGRALAAFGLGSHTREGMTGVFVGSPHEQPPRKVASIGVGVRHWVSWHGFALNVDIDLDEFAVIVPCGLDGVAMTSLAAELGPAAPGELPARAREEVARAFVDEFAAGPDRAAQPSPP